MAYDSPMGVIEEPGPHPEPSDAVAAQVYREQSRLLDVFEKAANRGINLLLLWNGGGAIALLSYLGAVSEARYDGEVLASLVVFLLGMTLVGIAAATDFGAASARYEAFNNAAGEFYGRKIGWHELWESADPPLWVRVLGFASGYLSLVCAIAGSGIGVWSVLARAAATAHC